MTARNRLAARGFRRHQRPRRSTQAMGRARIGSPASQRRSSSASSAASCVAPGRRTGQGLEADGLQVARHLVVELAWRPGVVLQHLQQQHAAVAAKRPFAGQQLVEDDAKAVDVAAGIDPVRFAAGLLGRHVGRRPQHLSFQGERQLLGTPSRAWPGPKSMTCGWPCSSIMMLSGFRSRWMMPCWWA